MTFSIVARQGAALGVAVASKFLSVGALVPAAEVGAGALATQAWANVAYRPQGMALLRSGVGPAGVLAALLAADEGRAHRQLGVVGADGTAVTHTGEECLSWAGGLAGDGYAVQGNILTGPEVVRDMEAAWLASAGRPFAERLLAALAAGDAAGGDARGRQSAALYVVDPGRGVGGWGDTAYDLRVDDHADPVAELGRLLAVHEVLHGASDPETLLPLEGELAAEVGALLRGLGHDSLDRWAGIENLEGRLAEGRIDPLVLNRLRSAAG
ncbi:MULTISPECIES: DUF1028 domain-containing protein [Kitasatospora]|uniref:Putative peptidoglycan binding domain-containing protein n=1 Tax=Kitasatospora setae (strain ATCC 33774 / DSM 43861 / JCM 3304 / KCC A-0304 / NBRC 14216 / KM-6054) TaxID=452652 RepID=E4N164_KITSK|nr:DUF1028 domain-containing protein [Kitasatospora setae]BAJ31898.1 hypothetical protein KSE_61320 [Kitasatospora setae KM-6054]